ncbi:MAG: hypothetical protein A2945_02140 [Candidatus Liptonbacteria bacterium RIFCSPLOWO2_01_FULL_52_25]|uniref:Uncharacterized protein n=1 Tax=Candidatus Liptonbacteria bacterium RIFCSPLOWO2_01_FULL_52_25 TaxID=1798650 RepID=A0A1G2CEG9_9BACT|nr:MAG: hypothetical protein A2945_02140 [Candidatus Liptonbacteria bacterium RIFCSPLOWO2_01_FULL_52_25]
MNKNAAQIIARREIGFLLCNRFESCPEKSQTFRLIRHAESPNRGGLAHGAGNALGNVGEVRFGVHEPRYRQPHELQVGTVVFSCCWIASRRDKPAFHAAHAA